MCVRCVSWVGESYDTAERMMTGSYEEILSSNNAVINITVAIIPLILFAVLHDKMDVFKHYLPSSERSQKSQAFSVAYKLRKFDICVLFLENDLSFLQLIEYEPAIGNINFLLKLFIHFVKKGADINTKFGDCTMLDLLKKTGCRDKIFIKKSIQMLVELGAKK
jgi:hypothetical protein